MADKKDKKETRLRVMPNSYEAEQAVLAAMLLDNELCTKYLPSMTEDDFYSVANRKIYRAICELNKEGGAPVDVIGVISRLNRRGELDEVGGVSALENTINSIPSTANSDFYFSLLKRDSSLRAIIRRCNDVIERAYTDDNADSVRTYAEAQFFDMGIESGSGDLRHVGEPMGEIIKKLNDVYTHKEVSKGLLTGFKNLDNVLNGLLPGQIVIVAARPGLGKTSFALNIVNNIITRQEDHVIAMFNLEMSAGELAQRMLVNMSKISMQKLVKGQEDAKDWSTIWDVYKVMGKSGLYVDDTVNITPDDMLHKCRALKKKAGRLDLIVVDYLQLMTSNKERKSSSKQQEVSDISRGMKIMAKELGVPVILLSQMSRDIEKREKDDKNTLPKLSDLRESGAIEQDADIVMFLHRAEDSLETTVKNVQLIIAKHRNGPTDILYFIFDGDKMRFDPTANKGSVFNSAPKKEEGEKEQGYSDDGYVPDDEYMPPEAPPDDGVPQEDYPM